MRKYVKYIVLFIILIVVGIIGINLYGNQELNEKNQSEGIASEGTNTESQIEEKREVEKTDSNEAKTVESNSSSTKEIISSSSDQSERSTNTDAIVTNKDKSSDSVVQEKKENDAVSSSTSSSDLIVNSSSSSTVNSSEIVIADDYEIDVTKDSGLSESNMSTNSLSSSITSSIDSTLEDYITIEVEHYQEENLNEEISNTNSSSQQKSSQQKSSNQDTIITESSENSQSATSSTSTNSQKETSVTNFNLEKTFVVLGHYTSKINSYVIKIFDNKGQVLKNDKFTFKSSNSGVASVSDVGKVVANFGGKAIITVASKNDPSYVKKIQVEVISSLYTRVKVSKTVTGTSLLTGKKVTLAQGTNGIYNGLGRRTDDSGKINGSLFGNIILVNKDYILLDVKYVKPYQYYIFDVYNERIVETFVNTYGFDSNTKYLFWTSQGTQTEYMFTGSKGKWKLYKTFIVNTGDSSLILYSSSSVTGVHFNYVVGEHAAYSGYPMGVIWKRKPDGGRTNPWHQYGTGKRYPASHGCTRFSTKDLQYLINNNSKFKGSRLIDY